MTRIGASEPSAFGAAKGQNPTLITPFDKGSSKIDGRSSPNRKIDC
jgi:hypothetical protein